MITQPGKILFEKFEILQCIKKDGYSCVYTANHIYLGKTIFLKTLAKDKISDPAVLHRFQREAKSLASINHPNIIQVYDLGIVKDSFYISFEYFKSRDLRAVINEKKMTTEIKLAVFKQIIQGLAEAHQHHIIHRDIKPENILVNEFNQVKIADFGLALIRDDINQTSQESIVGTPGYMSPEQIMGEVLTPASDLFSLGIVGYELFTGHNPFMGQDAGATINNILSCDVNSLLENAKGIPEQVNHVLKQLLSKNRAKRPASAQELFAGFDIDQHEFPVQPPQVPTAKTRQFIIPAIVLVFLILAVVFYFFLQADKTFIKDNNPLGADSTRFADQQPVSISPAETEKKREIVPLPGNETPAVINDVMDEQDENERQTLEQPGKLYVQCMPWADVIIDSQKIETTPLDGYISILAGTHELILQHPEYPAFAQEIEMSPGADLYISVNLDTLVGYLDCQIYPWGNVFIDNEFKGQTPLQNPVRLEPGKYMLTLKNENFGAIDEYIEIVRKDTLHFKFNFERLVAGKKTIQP